MINFIKGEMLELIAYPFALLVMFGYTVAFYIMLFYFLITCFAMSVILLLWEKFSPLIFKLVRKIPMPDFDDYDTVRINARKVFRMKRYKAALERIKHKYPLLSENSEQFKRAINKLLKY